jgi:hypothetical protein
MGLCNSSRTRPINMAPLTGLARRVWEKQIPGPKRTSFLISSAMRDPAAAVQLRLPVSTNEVRGIHYGSEPDIVPEPNWPFEPLPK